MPTDAQLVAAKQACEVYYVAHRYNAPARVVRKIIKQVGHSRRKVYAELGKLGYVVVNKK